MSIPATMVVTKFGHLDYFENAKFLQEITFVPMFVQNGCSKELNNYFDYPHLKTHNSLKNGAKIFERLHTILMQLSMKLHKQCCSNNSE